MACGSGCCKPAASPPAPSTPAPAPAPVPASSPIEQQKDEPTEADRDDCQDTCCGAEVEPSPLKSKCEEPGNSCCAPPPAPADCHGSDDGCKATVDDDSASRKVLDPELPRCKDACCSAPPEPSAPDADDPACCKGRASPCCDTSCLDRIARRSCDGDSKCDARGDDGRPCSKHRSSARERYAARLHALGCICRALIALGQESCCLPVERSPSLAARARGSKKARVSIDSCCGTPATTAATTSSGKTCGKPAVSKKRSRDSCCITSSCSPPAEDACAKGCCGQRRAAKPPSVADSCSDACCAGGKEKESSTKTVDAISCHVVATMTDPEKGLKGSEHIVLSISGMTVSSFQGYLTPILVGRWGTCLCRRRLSPLEMTRRTQDHRGVF